MKIGQYDIGRTQSMDTRVQLERYKTYLKMKDVEEDESFEREMRDRRRRQREELLYGK